MLCVAIVLPHSSLPNGMQSSKNWSSWQPTSDQYPRFRAPRLHIKLLSDHNHNSETIDPGLSQTNPRKRENDGTARNRGHLATNAQQ